MKRYLLDSNIFDAILDQNLSIEALQRSGRFVVTQVQQSEIRNIPNEGRRIKLLHVLQLLDPEKLPLDSGIWLDDLHWDDEQPWRDDLGSDCEHFTKGKENKPWKDALIGEVAKHHDLILVSNDAKFLKKAVEAGIQTMSLVDFLAHVRCHEIHLT
jgi:predicted nucleic acid-binding protein